MRCTAPQTGYRPPPGAENRRLVFSARDTYEGAVAVQMACGRCFNCLTTAKQQWTMRIVHEAKVTPPGLFHTFTYRPEDLPSDFSLSKREMQLLMKRVRNEFGAGVRFFGCGEYGESPGAGLHPRPHYHVMTFGFALPDMKPYKRSTSGEMLYSSEAMSRVWPFGVCLSEHICSGNAAYVAGYTTKKRREGATAAQYRRAGFNSSGEIHEWDVLPEFALMSRRPGVGAGFVDRYCANLEVDGCAVLDGHKVPIGRFYLGKLPEAAREAIKAERKRVALEHVEAHPEDHNACRLIALHELGRIRAKRNRRNAVD